MKNKVERELEKHICLDCKDQYGDGIFYQEISPDGIGTCPNCNSAKETFLLGYVKASILDDLPNELEGLNV